MACHFCSAAATAQCRRCGKLYCDAHGDASFCDACLDPASALPSAALYRGSLLALLLGTVVALWLLVRPAETRSDRSLRSDAGPPVTVTLAPEETTPTPVVEAEATGTPSPAATEEGETPTPTPTRSPRATLTPTASPTPTESPTPTGPFEYTVQEGDTLSTLAERFALTVDEIKAANDLPDDIVRVGQTLIIPVPTPTETASETPTEAATGTPTETPAAIETATGTPTP